MIDAYEAGDVAKAPALHRELLPVYTRHLPHPGRILTKAALALAGLPGGPVRLPLVDATEAAGRDAAGRPGRPAGVALG